MFKQCDLSDSTKSSSKFTKRSALEKYKEEIASARSDIKTEIFFGANLITVRIKGVVEKLQNPELSNIKFIHATNDLYNFLDYCNEFIDEFEKHISTNTKEKTFGYKEVK